MSHARLVGVAVVAAWLAVVATGCGGPPATHYYMLELTPQPHTSTGAGAGDGIAVGIRPFQVDPPYDQDRIVYRVRDRYSEVGFYAYHRWATPLSRMLPLAVASGLAGADGVGRIEPTAAGRTYDAYLGGRLLALEEVDHPAGQDVILRLELSLRGADGQELWSEVLAAEDTIDTREVGDIVERMRQVLARAVDEARGSFEAAISDARAGG